MKSHITKEDIDNILEMFENQYQWDKKNAKECGWSERDLTMIAEGLYQATECLRRYFLFEYLE